MRDEDRKEISYRQLCAILKTVLQQEPSIEDSEWKARTRDTLAKWGFREPNTDQLSRAMASVEHALKQTIGPRPSRLVLPPKGDYVPPVDPPESSKRTTRPAGWDIVVALMASLQLAKQGSDASEPSCVKPQGPRETLAISEEDAIAEFWRAAGSPETDRLSLLKAYAELAIVRPAHWDYLAVRAHAHEHSLIAEKCFACWNNDRGYHWHHVIQIQHGGSNYVRNRVPLCTPCHAEIHPWLTNTPSRYRTAGSWFQIGGISPAFLEKVRKRA